MSLNIYLTKKQVEKLEQAFMDYSNNPGCNMQASNIRIFLVEYLINTPGMDVPVMTALKYLYQKHADRICWDLNLS